MKKTIMRIAVILTVAAMIFAMGACGNETAPETNSVLYSSSNGSPIELGSGSKHLDFSVDDADGNIYKFHIHTDKTIVGEALEELGIIEGTEGDYGLYVEKVNGITAKYEVDGTYWAFYINGEYAMTGIDVTEIVDGTAYAMKIEK